VAALVLQGTAGISLVLAIRALMTG
jgi:hypothetical protein